MMRNKILVLGLMLVGVCMTAMAQARGNIIKYIDENKLYRNGNDVTVTNLDLQWPVALDGDGMPELQKELCKNKQIYMLNLGKQLKNALRQPRKESTIH